MKRHVEAHRVQNAYGGPVDPVSDRRGSSCSAHPQNGGGLEGERQVASWWEAARPLPGGAAWPLPATGWQQGDGGFPSGGPNARHGRPEAHAAHGLPPNASTLSGSWSGEATATTTGGPAQWRRSGLWTTHGHWLRLGEPGKAGLELRKGRGIPEPGTRRKDRCPGGDHPGQRSFSTQAHAKVPFGSLALIGTTSTAAGGRQLTGLDPSSPEEIDGIEVITQPYSTRKNQATGWGSSNPNYPPTRGYGCLLSWPKLLWGNVD